MAKNKDLLIDEVVHILRKAGFVTSATCDIRPRCFDLAARRDDVLILVKVYYNIDGFNSKTAAEMRELAKHLAASAVVVGSIAREQPLETGVTYIRYGVSSINLETLYDYFIENLPPLVYAAPGGLYVSIDGDVLKEARKSKSISIGTLASEAGVSRRTISKYEEEGMDASVEVAFKLEDILDVAISQSIDILEVHAVHKKDLPPPPIEPGADDTLTILKDLGLDVYMTKQAPFKAVSHNADTTMLTGVSIYNKTMVKRAQLMSNISEVAHTQSIYIVEGKCKPKSIENTILIEKRELSKVESSDDLLSIMDAQKGSGQKLIGQ